MNSWLKKRIRLGKIRQKYFVTMLLISILPIAFLGLVSYNITINTLVQKQQQATENHLKASSKSVDLLLRNVINLERLFSWNQDLQTELKKSAENNETKSSTITKETLERINYIIYSYFIDTQDIDSVCLFDIQQRPYCYGNSNSIGDFDNGGSFPEITKEKWYQEGLKGDGSISFFSSNVLVGDQSKDTFSSVKVLRDVNGVFEEKNLGILVVNVKKSLFKRAINESVNNYTMVFDSSGINLNSVYDNSSSGMVEDIHKNTLEETLENLRKEGNLVSSFKNNTTGWILVHIIEEKELFSQSSGIRKATAMLSIFMLVVSLYLSFIASGRLSRPFLYLKSLTADWRGKKQEQSGEIHRDEISEISETFKQVATEHKELTEELIGAQLKEREAELKLLQAQIKPHFLYNTLDSMYWMALINKNHDIAKMAFALSESFKISLSKGKESILVFEELEHIRHYITIQNIRFQNRFTYIEDVDPIILNKPILKLLLQPLVENAIFHGLEPKVGMGTIKVTGRLENQKLVFIVEDDGIGIDDLEKTKKGFGMGNVQERIQLFYGPESGFHVTSVVGKGTKVELCLAVKNGGIADVKSNYFR
jgi:two-component system, sensor histidine kinase YesM